MEWMTEVQQRSIPAIMEGRDLLVKSQTGSGLLLCVPCLRHLIVLTMCVHFYVHAYYSYVALKLYGVNATIIIFVFVLYCIVLHSSCI